MARQKNFDTEIEKLKNQIEKKKAELEKLKHETLAKICNRNIMKIGKRFRKKKEGEKDL